MAVAALAQSFFLNSLAYFFYAPVYKCIADDQSEFICSKREACSTESQYKLVSSIFSLNMKFELVCDQENLAVMGAIFILVVSGIISCLVFILVDFIGRKKMFYLATTVQCLGLMMSLLIPSYELIIAGLTMAFTGHYLWFANCYVYSNEIMGGSLRVISIPCLCTVVSAGMIFTHWVSEFIYRYDFFIIANLVSIVLTGFFYLFFEESPFFLYRFSSLGTFYNCLRAILYQNYQDKQREHRLSLLKSLLFNPNTDLDRKFAQIEARNVDEDQNVQQVDLENLSMESLEFDPDLPDSLAKSPTPSDQVPDFKSPKPVSALVLDLKFKDLSPSLKTTYESNSYCDLFNLENGLPFLGIIMLSLPLFIGDALTLYPVQSMGVDSVSTAGILMGFFELFGNLLAFFCSSLFARKKSNIICQISIFLAVSCLIVVDYNNQNIENAFDSSKMFEISEGILCLIIRLAISFNLSTIFTYNMELFPTHLRSLSLIFLVFIE
ncbi:MAG: hypothetical protein AAF202_08575, partial [Pseudomonadota bacterium]